MSLLFKTLKKHRQPYKGFLFFYLLLALIVSIASVLMTRLTGDIGQAALNFDTSALLRFIGVFTAVMLIRAIASASSALILGRFGGRAGYRFRDNFVKYFLRKPFSSFESVNSGEALSVYSNDIPAAVTLVADQGLRMIADVITLVVTFVYMLTLTVPLTLILFASFPILAAMQIVIAIPIQKKQVRQSETRAAFTAVVNDSLQNTSTIAAYSLEDVMEKRCANSFAEILVAVRAFLMALMPLVMSGMIASQAPLMIIIAISANRVIGGNMTIAEFIAFVGLAGVAGSWLAMLSQRQNWIQTAAAGAKRLIDTMPDDEENLTTGKVLTSNGDIAVSVKNLSFSYNKDSEDNEETPPTLDNISFQIKKGSRVAFVGGSGSGKSTVLKLLLGLYSANSGEISIMGTNISEVSLESLRNAYAYVPQDSFLFPESIGENITGEATITDIARLEAACTNAGILDFIYNLPDQFNAILNESAENISGGQKQRIALARAFYRNSPIILFDEATSALDPSTEAAILKSFDTLAKDKTVVMIAHRLKAIDFCDTIIVMDSGKIVATGTHDELLNSCELYKNLYESQVKEAI